MQRRAFIKGLSVVAGAAPFWRPSLAQGDEQPILEMVSAGPKSRDTRFTDVPIIGLGQAGWMVVWPEVARCGPPANYWALTPYEPNRPPRSVGSGNQDGFDYRVVTDEKGIGEALVDHLEEAPIAFFVGDPREQFVAERAPWLQTVLARTGTHPVWIAPPWRVDLPGSPLSGPLLNGVPGWRTGMGGPFILPTTSYYARTLWGALRSLARPTLVGVDLADLPGAYQGRYSVFAKGLGEGPGRVGKAVQAAIEQAKAHEQGPGQITGAVQQVHALEEELTIGEIDEASKQFKALMPVQDGEDVHAVLGAPLGGDKGRGRTPDRVAVDLIVTWA